MKTGSPGEILYAEGFIERAGMACRSSEQKIEHAVEQVCKLCGNVYRKSERSNSKVCCFCKKKKRALNHGSAVKVAETFPRKDKFRTKKEIEEYLNESDESIACLLCGNEYKSLPKHLVHIHDVTPDEYREMYGLFYATPLISMDLRLIASETMLENFRTGRLGEEPWKLASRNRGNARTPRHAPAFTETMVEGGRRASESENAIHKRTGKVRAICSDCGNDLGRLVSEFTLITKECYLLCKKCQSEHHKQSQIGWAERNGINYDQWVKDNCRRHYLKKKKETET